jgi:hypothetical protein
MLIIIWDALPYTCPIIYRVKFLNLNIVVVGEVTEECE